MPVRRAVTPPEMSDQSKIGSRVRERLSSKKPSVPATSSTPSQSLPGGLAPRGRRDDRAEERDTVDRDDRRADLHAHLVHPGVVRLLSCSSNVGRGHRVGQVGRQADLGERLLDGGPVLRALLEVEAGAERGVQRQHDVVAVRGGRRDDDPHRAPGLRPSAPVVLRQVPALVEVGQRHHVPADRRRRGPSRPRASSARHPGPRADRVEPEVGDAVCRRVGVMSGTTRTIAGSAFPVEPGADARPGRGRIRPRAATRGESCPCTAATPTG